MKIFKDINEKLNNKKTEKKLNKGLCKLRKLKVKAEESGNPTYKKIMMELINTYNAEVLKAYRPCLEMLNYDIRCFTRMYEEAMQRGESECRLSEIYSMVEEASEEYRVAMDVMNSCLI